MSGALAMGLAGKKAAVTVATFGEVFTVFGGLTGALLLLDSPLTIQCATLTAYLFAMTVLYVVGFGMGTVEDARLVRNK